MDYTDYCKDCDHLNYYRGRTCPLAGMTDFHDKPLAGHMNECIYHTKPARRLKPALKTSGKKQAQPATPSTTD